MAGVARRASSPMADMLEWLESNTPLSRTGVGPTPYVRVEDYIEDDDYVLRAEVPGIDPEQDLEVTVDNDMLTISGERREESKEKNRRELHYGSFRRTVQLPSGARADEITASYTDGVLEVRVPTARDEAPSVKIPINRAE